MVTAGEFGAAYSFGSGSAESHGFQPVFDVAVADTTGAGDAFTAGFAYRVLADGGVAAVLASPALLRRAVIFAAACGALTCSKPGAIAAQPTADEVEQLARSQVADYARLV